jgi:tryptophan halogenase
MQRSPWIGNCIAIGEAAIAVDPIDGVELQVTHGCISHLMTLFPSTAKEFPEAEAYNQTIRLFGSNIRDFQAAHYLLNRRFDEPMWDRIRAAEMPPTLKRKIDMFRARALVPVNDEESFHDQLWTLLLLGSGVMPEGYDPRIDGLSDQQHIDIVQKRLCEVAMMARAMPSVDQILDIEQSAPAQVIG